MALYWLEKRLLTYWLMRDVLPTLYAVRAYVRDTLWWRSEIPDGDGGDGDGDTPAR